MPTVEPLGIVGIESLHFYVRDLDRMGNFLVDKLDFAEIGRCSDAMRDRAHQASRGYRAGDVTFIVSAPEGAGGRADRWLRKHPEGVGTLNFRVEDADKTWRLLDERGGTFIDALQDVRTPDGGRLRFFSITTPFGDTTFRFVERTNTELLYPDFVPHQAPTGGRNRLGIERLDHITSNFQTMKPMLLWMEHVMGFKQFWDVKFHTVDVSDDHTKGSGLKSVVMKDPYSGVKFANNEPAPPFFKKSQINLFGEDHRGDGVQHAAITVRDIIPAVRDMRARGVEFMPTPGSYYDMMPDRLRAIGVNAIDEDIAVLRELEILVDGDHDHAYLLQIFLKEQAGLFKDRDAGPFFIEVIQRKGDEGFGAGNFRALFESIERDHAKAGRI